MRKVFCALGEMNRLSFIKRYLLFEDQYTNRVDMAINN